MKNICEKKPIDGMLYNINRKRKKAEKGSDVYVLFTVKISGREN